MTNMDASKKPWDNLISNEDRLVVEGGGYGKTRGLGKRPLVMVIDLQYNYVGDNQPILEQIDKWPSGGGQRAWKAIEKINILIEKARDKEIPVLYTRNVQSNITFDSFSNKTDRDQSSYIDGHQGTMIIKEIAPHKEDMVLDKAYPSAFYGTVLQSWLVKLGIDTLILTGGSTCGCVRSTAIDAVSRNYNVAVVEQCVYDRIQVSHQASLFDLWMKFCDVIQLDNALNYIETAVNPALPESILEKG